MLICLISVPILIYLFYISQSFGILPFDCVNHL